MTEEYWNSPDATALHTDPVEAEARCDMKSTERYIQTHRLTRQVSLVIDTYDQQQ